MLSRLLIALAFLTTTSGAALAQSQSTDIRPNANRVVDADLREAFAGVTHEGAYNFSLEGRASNFYTEAHTSLGRVNYTEDGQPLTGDWAIYRDMVCYSYDNPQMNGGCFRVYQVGTCYYFYSAQLREHPDELDRDYWTARSVKAGDKATCEAVFS